MAGLGAMLGWWLQGSPCIGWVLRSPVVVSFGLISAGMFDRQLIGTHLAVGGKCCLGDSGRPCWAGGAAGPGVGRAGQQC